MTEKEHREAILANPESRTETIDGVVYVQTTALVDEFGVSRQTTKGKLERILHLAHKSRIEYGEKRASFSWMWPLDEAVHVMVTNLKPGAKPKPKPPKPKLKYPDEKWCVRCVYSAIFSGSDAEDQRESNRRYCAFAFDTGTTRLGQTAKHFKCSSYEAMKKLEGNYDEDCPFFQKGRRNRRANNCELFVNHPGRHDFDDYGGCVQEPDGECPGYDFSKL